MTTTTSGRRPTRLEWRDLDAHIDDLLNRRAAVGFALAVVRGEHLEYFRGHGVADVDSHSPITEDTVFRIASISKTFTAIGVMQLVERGLVELDAPVNQYLRDFQLIPHRPSERPATVRHLLTHTSGIPEVLHAADLLRPDWGDSVALGARLPSLAEVYASGIPLEAEPGMEFRYTNHGFAALQQVVEDVSGERFDHYLRRHIFEPLGMTSTDIVRTEAVAAALATGYTLGSGGPVPVVERQWVTPGASSIYSTTRDMSRYIGALLGGGSNRHGMVLKPETLGTMYQAQYQPHPLIPGMGLGFERADAAGHLVVGHGGILPGFNSQLFVAPEDGVGVFAVTNGAAVAMLWLPTELSRVLNRLLDVPDAVIRTDVPHHPEIWPRITGWYELPGRLTDIRARMMVGAGVQVRVEGGRPILRILTPIPGLMRGLPLHPDDPTDPYVFRIDLAEFGLPAARIVFGRGPGGVATAVHLDIFPMSLRRRFATRPSLGVRGRVALSVGLSLVASLAATAVARRLRGRRRMQG